MKQKIIKGLIILLIGYGVLFAGRLVYNMFSESSTGTDYKGDISVK